MEPRSMARLSSVWEVVWNVGDGNRLRWLDSTEDEWCVRRRHNHTHVSDGRQQG